MKTHPLSPDEERRLFAREARAGDTLDRVRVTFDDCFFELASHDRELDIWMVHVPIDARRVRVVTDKLEEIEPGNNAQLTFERGKLKSVMTL